MSTVAKCGCDCIQKTNDKLRVHGCGIETNLLSDPPRAIISTYKLSTAKRGDKQVLLEGAYCPFCGAEYPRKADLASQFAGATQ